MRSAALASWPARLASARGLSASHGGLLNAIRANRAVALPRCRDADLIASIASRRFAPRVRQPAASTATTARDGRTAAPIESRVRDTRTHGVCDLVHWLSQSAHSIGVLRPISVQGLL